MSFEPHSLNSSRNRFRQGNPRSARRLLLGALLLCGLVGIAFALQAVRQVRAHAAAGQDLAALAPPGALLAIQSPDFAALLQQWNGSAEQKAWLGSANYSVFSNSRLFGRLNDAEGEFAKASGVPAARLLPQVAGRQSLFAWYDVGNLEFLYITRMAPGQAGASDLLRQRARFSQRSAGGIAFFVRTANDPAAGTHRTVAFATAGDLLLLATREDLMAGALERLAKSPAQAATSESLAAEPWFTQASAALSAAPTGAGMPVLHMVLNLERIVPMPYFRSYWIQGNITEMSHFRAAAADLYEEKGDFREERALLPSDDEQAGATASGPGPELASLAVLAPPAGVFRASATADPDEAVAVLGEKLLGRAASSATPPTLAADPSLDATPAGEDPDAASATGDASASGATAGNSDLDTRIDTPPPVSTTSSDQPLVNALRAAGLNGILSWSAAGPVGASGGGLWIPVHAAVVLRGSSPWNAPAVAAALQASLRGQLTTGALGIEFRSQPGAPGVFSLTGPKPLLFAVRDAAAGHLLFLADTRALLDDLLHRAETPDDSVVAEAQGASAIAGFDHGAARAPYARLTALIDGTGAKTNPPDATGGPAAGDAPAGVAPALFSLNLRSLSDAFAALASERFVERRVSTAAGPVVRQTVLYRWQSARP